MNCDENKEMNSVGTDEIKDTIVTDAVEVETDDVQTANAEAAEESKVVYDEVLRNEKGLIKREGFKMNGVNYGPEFEEENLNKAFKTAIAGVCIMIPLFALVIYLFWQHFKPFIGN